MQSSKLDDGFMSYTRHLKRLKKEEYKQLQSVVCDNQFAVSLNLSISQSEKEDGRSTVSERSKGTHVVKE